MNVANGGAVSFTCVASGGGGAGGNVCPDPLPTFPNAVASCDEETGVLRIDCAPGYANANGDFQDGCEFNLNPPQPELCDGIDNDQDGVVDDMTPQPVPHGVVDCQSGGYFTHCLEGWSITTADGPQSGATGFNMNGCDIPPPGGTRIHSG
jgi:hypothetical protein